MVLFLRYHIESEQPMGQHDTTTDARMGTESFREVTTSKGTLRLPDLTVSELSLKEKLFLWRRRKGFGQKEAADFLNVSVTMLRHIERSHDEKCHLENLPELYQLHPIEICLILRRRAGLTIPDCAEQAGVSRYWYNLMEQGKASENRLLAFWGEYEG